MATNIYNRARIVDGNLKTFLENWSGFAERRIGERERVRPDAPLTGGELLDLYDSQVVSRHLDLVSRELRLHDRAYYTIGSSGHEGNAVLGLVTRSTDPAFLHYRSGALVVQRAKKHPGVDVVYETLLGSAASSEDPTAGGRHKVWGSRPLWIVPQTSTIASHLPKAVGMAIGVRRAAKLGVEPPIPRDSVVLCSFGDASVNHSTAAGAFVGASRAGYQKLNVPILFVCEDNGIGISVRTPAGWIEQAFSTRPGIRYFRADGLDLVEAHRAASEAVEYCRRSGQPTFLHFRTVRLMGHAGTDVELEYRTLEDVAATEALDPLLASARLVLEAGLRSSSELLEHYEATRARVAEAAARATSRPKLATAAQVLEPLAPYHPEAVQAEARRPAAPDARRAAFGGDDKLPERLPSRHLAANINLALHDLLAKYPEAVLFGEDVAQKGGVYHVSAGLLKRFGESRVFNTILDETNILGLAQGFGYCGLLPLPEIQYLAYFHNACDQIRGEACSLQYFSCDQFRNPMVIRIAGLAYQKGFGGHFHNDNSVAALRDIPGLVIACPSRGDDAVGMLRTAMALARVDGRVIAFLEPIALYMTKDLHAAKDGLWQFPYPAEGQAVELGTARVYHEDATDLCILTYGNGTVMSLQAARTLHEQDGVRARVVDLRWLAPLDLGAVARHAAACGRVLVVDEGRRTGGVGEALVTAVVEGCGAGIPIVRIAGEDVYIPLGPAANLVLPQVEGVLAGARRVLATPSC